MTTLDRLKKVVIVLGIACVGANCNPVTTPDPPPPPPIPPSLPTPLPPTAPPVALRAHAGGPYQSYVNRNLTFNGSRSTTPNPPIQSLFWDFGDGTPETNGGMWPVHRYAFWYPRGGSRTYTVRLRIVDSAGRSAIGWSTVVISDFY